MSGTGIATDRLWVPLLSHYRPDDDTVILDINRIAAHMQALRPNVGQILLAGSTGDGWELSDQQIGDLLDMVTREAAFAGVKVLVGALGATTKAVIERARMIEEAAATWSLDTNFAGLAVCPPIVPDATQSQIAAHYEDVLAVTACDIAAYQLPQVTGCSIAPDTMRALSEHPRVKMFKDTSGTDTVATFGLANILCVRGAEGEYARALSGAMGYQGCLLSSGNVFAPTLRRIIALIDEGKAVAAERLSERLTNLVLALFDIAAPLPFGNPFSNTARAVDHLLAFGSEWKIAPPPLTVSNNRLPSELLVVANDLLFSLGESVAGYWPPRDA